MFKGSVKITILVRTSDDIKGDVLMGDDDFATVIEHMSLLRMEKPTFEIGEEA